MSPQLWYVTWLPVIPVLLVHLAGVITASVLLLRRRTTPALLALLGFGALFVATLADLARQPLLMLLPPRMSLSQVALTNAGLGCCCSLLDVLAFTALLVALWQGTPTEAPAQADEVVEATWEEVAEWQ